MTSQLDLPLSQDPTPPASAAVLAFPGNRRVGQARHVAAKFAELECRYGRKRAEGYWRSIADTYHRMLTQAGVSEADANRELCRFRAAVREAKSGGEARRA